MSTGKAHKFQGSVFQALIAYDDSSPGTAITGATNANPVVVTAPSHGLGDANDLVVVKHEEVGGMVEIIGVYIAQVIDANSYRLLGIDGTGYGIYTSGGVVRGGEFSRWCEITGFNRQGGQAPEIDTSDSCSDAATFIRGMKDNGSIQFDLKYLPDEALQQALEDFDDSGDYLAVRYRPAGSTTDKVAVGFISSLGEAAQSQGIWTRSLTFRVSGPIYRATVAE